MSYILEALKKAEAERHAEVVQPRILPSGLGAARQPLRQDGKRVRLWTVALVSSALFAIGAGVTWYATDRGAPLEATAPVAEQPAAPAPIPAVPAAPAPATPAMPPPVADSAVEPAVKPKEDVAKKAQAKRRRPADEPTRSAANSPAANEIALPTLRELPEQLQRELPSLSVGGYIYSGNRADRSVLINKRLLREGDEIAPGLVLEQMMKSEMVLNYKGYRYRVPY